MGLPLDDCHDFIAFLLSAAYESFILYFLKLNLAIKLSLPTCSESEIND